MKKVVNPRLMSSAITAIAIIEFEKTIAYLEENNLLDEVDYIQKQIKLLNEMQSIVEKKQMDLKEFVLKYKHLYEMKS